MAQIHHALLTVSKPVTSGDEKFMPRILSGCPASVGVTSGAMRPWVSQAAVHQPRGHWEGR